LMLWPVTPDRQWNSCRWQIINLKNKSQKTQIKVAQRLPKKPKTLKKGQTNTNGSKNNTLML
jgi:hypothetical protein